MQSVRGSYKISFYFWNTKGRQDEKSLFFRTRKRLLFC